MNDKTVLLYFTPGKVKELLSQEIGVPPDKQSLRGWSTRKTRVEDDVSRPGSHYSADDPACFI
jgi:hypothetical protein